MALRLRAITALILLTVITFQMHLFFQSTQLQSSSILIVTKGSQLDQENAQNALITNLNLTKFEQQKVQSALMLSWQYFLQNSRIALMEDTVLQTQPNGHSPLFHKPNTLFQSSLSVQIKGLEEKNLNEQQEKVDETDFAVVETQKIENPQNEHHIDQQYGAKHRQETFKRQDGEQDKEKELKKDKMQIKDKQNLVFLMIILMIHICKRQNITTSGKMVNFMINLLVAMEIAKAILQRVSACSTVANCVDCSTTSTQCNTCATDYFPDGTKQCKLCSSQIPNCKQCSGWWPCDVCQPGYNEQWGSCVLPCTTPGCYYCPTNPAQCQMCVNTNQYYHDWSNKLCHLCNTGVSNCHKCTSENSCYQCETGYRISYSTSPPSCQSCTIFANCLTCKNGVNSCVTCVPTAYKDGAGNCNLCSVPMIGCDTCTSSSTCSTCIAGFTLNTGTNKCQCDPVANSLSNCLTCSGPTTCLTCTPNTHYLNTIDTLCYPCPTFDSNCVNCNVENVCTLCAVNYGVKTNPDTTATCSLCFVEILNCLQCAVTTACTTCIGNYYVDASTTCSKCSDNVLGCLNCTRISSVITCSLCDTNWTLTSPTCTCNPVSSGLSNCITCTSPTVCATCTATFFYLNSTDTHCYSCSYFDSNCVECSVQKICTLCAVNYGVKTNADTTTTCTLCSTEIVNCLLCKVTSACTTCVAGYYVDASTSCSLCKTTVVGCQTCSLISSVVTCSVCDPGWNLTAPTCTCDPPQSNLSNCQTCQTPIKCLTCVSLAFYLSTTDNKCYPCTSFDPNCLECTQLNHCTKCALYYGLKTFPDTTTQCIKCRVTLANCSECTIDGTCTKCDYGYGLNGILGCTLCSIPFLGCIDCLTTSACTLCDPVAFLVAGQCHYCSQIPNCKTCSPTPTELICIQCPVGFYLTPNLTTGKIYCRDCMYFTPYCSNCNSLQCFSCDYPYLIGPDMFCSTCATGYDYNNGLCTNITGCQSAVTNSTGQVVCIACVQSLHFVMDQKTKKCICTVGYKEYIDKTKFILPQCAAICGDGIVISESQQCDDNNTKSGDGCTSTCVVETDFDCGSDQPSVCQLVINIESITFNHVIRQLGSNHATISFVINPKHNGLAGIEWSKIASFNFSKTVVNPALMSFSYQPGTSQLLVSFPYTQELEQHFVESTFKIDPTYLKSKKSFFMISHQLKGVNAPLIFDETTALETQKNVGLITLLLTAFLLLQFYGGSYSHKMIGLQTIQVIQSIYFVRLVAGSSSNSLMNSINSIQYSAGGYHNAQIFYGDVSEIQLNLVSSTSEQFLSIDLQRYFLLNANISMIPVGLAIVVFIVSLVRKYRARNIYLETKEQQQKDKYTNLRRSSQWVYDHFVFPYIMMFNLISYFQSILLMESPSKAPLHYEQMEYESFTALAIITLSTIAIYCYQLFNSLKAYQRYRMTDSQRNRQPSSTIEKLQHDDNNQDRANYHPAYIFLHLMYYFLLSLSMSASILMHDFDYSLQFCMTIAFIYLLIITFWKPYSGAVNIHNYFLRFNHFAFVCFLAICYVFTRLEPLQPNTYVGIMYVITVLIGFIMTGGFIRLYAEFNFRKALQSSSNLLSDIQKIPQKKQEDQVKFNQDGTPIPKPSRKEILMMNNQYTFETQLKHYEKRLIKESQIITSPFMKTILTSQSAKKDYLIKKIREEIHQSTINSFRGTDYTPLGSKASELPMMKSKQSEFPFENKQSESQSVMRKGSDSPLIRSKDSESSMSRSKQETAVNRQHKSRIKAKTIITFDEFNDE